MGTMGKSSGGLQFSWTITAQLLQNVPECFYFSIYCLRESFTILGEP